jgi:hypothetical protein
MSVVVENEVKSQKVYTVQQFVPVLEGSKIFEKNENISQTGSTKKTTF